MSKLLIGLCAVSLALSTSAFAFQPIATVSGIQGKVLVNQGQGFVVLSAATDLKAGDQVFVGSESRVLVSYLAKNCSVDISKPQTLTIGKVAPCKKGETVAALDSSFVTPVNGGMAGAGGLAAMDTTSMVVLGVVGIATIASVGYFISQNSNDTSCNAAVSACP
jgi:hypothetical protein